jgi:hypothetical protein
VIRRALAAAVVALCGCDANTPVAILPTPGQASGFCAGTGPAIIVGDGITIGEGDGSTDDVCSGAIARRTFRFALCLCEGYQSSTALKTDSFASSAGPYDPLNPGGKGSVGINRDLNVNADIDVLGSVWAGETGGTIGRRFSVSGDLMHAGGLMGAGALVVGNDATVLGSIALGGELTVGGQLIMPEGTTVSANPVNATVTPGSPPVQEPCACGNDDLVDIKGFIEPHVDLNDNAAIGLSKSALAGFANGTVLELPCGQYYLDTIDGQVGAELTLRIKDRVVLFVNGNMDLKGPVHIVLEEDGELDLFVGGLLSSMGDIEFGDPARPSKARLYIGGSGTINLSGSSVLAGNVYAPLAGLAVSADAELFGSLFIKQLQQSAPLTLHYDTDVLTADQGCPQSSGTCRTCLDCGGQACNAGTCGTCASNDDCCAPLVCDLATGSCVQH